MADSDLRIGSIFYFQSTLSKQTGGFSAKTEALPKPPALMSSAWAGWVLRAHGWQSRRDDDKLVLDAEVIAEDKHITDSRSLVVSEQTYAVPSSRFRWRSALHSLITPRNAVFISKHQLPCVYSAAIKASFRAAEKKLSRCQSSAAFGPQYISNAVLIQFWSDVMFLTFSFFVTAVFDAPVHLCTFNMDF